MNSAILHGARPNDSVPKGNFGGMPSEVIAMARQMGLTSEDMKQVNSMWKNMDDLAETDPDSYKKFTGDILAEGPPEKGGKPKTFIPNPSFVVKLKTTSDGGKGMKVNTLNGPQKFFLNMTSCTALEPPKDHTGRPMEKHERHSADGLELPLLVGEVRSCSDHSGDSKAALCVDAVFHPWVLDSCEDNNVFKAQVIDLAIQWVEQETHFQFDKKWKTIKSKYKGGLGDDIDSIQPMPFPIDRAINQNDPIDERKQKKKDSENEEEKKTSNDSLFSNPGLATQTPESLLKATLNAPQDEEQNSLFKNASIRMPGDIQQGHDQQSNKTSATPHKPLIEEVKPKTKAKPVVKKGFLKPEAGKTVPRLYDENGSTGDGAKEGGYSRLMSKCQVVDMSTMTPEQQKAAMAQHAAPASQPKPPATQAKQPPVPSEQKKVTAPPPPVAPVEPEESLDTSFKSLEKGFLEGKGLGSSNTSTKGGPSSRTTSDALFESLISDVDPDYAEASHPMGEGNASEDAMSSLSDIARVLAGQPGAEGASPASGTGTALKMMTPMRGIDEVLELHPVYMCLTVLF
mmetsp:Transcript_24691/g.29079  ORF Transcript_24691/g.29079 Transcript_24691/m.29079 type:complete len:570 (+) Transcript_24691:111-1820(+)